MTESGKISWRQTENERWENEMQKGCKAVSFMYFPSIISCVTHGCLHSSPSLSYTAPPQITAICHIRSGSKLVSIQFKSTNQWVFPSLNSLDFYCQNQITSLLYPTKPTAAVAFQLQASYLSKWTNEFEADHHQSQGRKRVAILYDMWRVDASTKTQKFDCKDKIVGQLWSPSRGE